MTTWIIEPRDPLIVRDGRPFGPNPGARARSLPFPFPSTITGGVRTRAGLKNGIFDSGQVPSVKNIGVRGPLLVELNQAGTIDKWLAPAPADVLLLPVEAENSEGQIECRRLSPLKQVEGARSNLPANLTLVGLTTSNSQKPYATPPHFWYWDKFKEWLIEPPHTQQLAVKELGHRGLLSEQRMHVRLDPDTFTGVEGFLFQTSGLEFVRPTETGMGIRLGLALETDAPLTEGVAPLGGERRLMTWRQVNTSWPAVPPQVKNQIAQTKACRLLLLTPAYFKEGYCPKWLGQAHKGVVPKLEAIALPHPQVVSGWDFEKGTPKPTRRLAPAGAVYFLKLEGAIGDVEQWVDEMWMQCVSDEPQAQLEGFGLAVLGTWSGQVQPMKEVS